MPRGKGLKVRAEELHVACVVEKEVVTEHVRWRGPSITDNWGNSSPLGCDHFRSYGGLLSIPRKKKNMRR